MLTFQFEILSSYAPKPTKICITNIENFSAVKLFAPNKSLFETIPIIHETKSNNSDAATNIVCDFNHSDTLLLNRPENDKKYVKKHNPYIVNMMALAALSSFSFEKKYFIFEFLMKQFIYNWKVK